MRLTASITGLDEVLARFKVLADLVPKAASKELKIALNEIKNDAQKSLTGPKSGIIYGAPTAVAKFKADPSKENQKEIHQASAPGEAPAYDKGNLSKNIRVVVDGDGLSGYVIANTPYAARLEFGDSTKTPGKPFIEARPYLFPALYHQTPLFIAGLKKALQEAIRR